jgi:predicted permease
LIFARVASRWIITLAAGGSAVAGGGGLTPTILGFTLAVSVLALGVFGLAPALQASRVDLAATMRSGAQPAASGSLGRGARRHPLGSLLISGQVALSIVLLVGAAILVRSLRNLTHTDLGFDRDHIIVAEIDIQTHGYVGTPLAQLVRVLREKLAAIPGVSGVTYSENGIFSGTDSGTSIEIPGFLAHSSDDTTIAYDNVGPGYASAIGGRVLAGRDLSASDEDKPARTALVNRTFADFYFPRASAVGKFVHFSDSIAVQIVGVIADVRDHALGGKLDRRMYFPYVHTDTGSHQLGNPGSLRLEVRTVGEPSALVEQVRKAIIAVDPSLPIDAIDPLPTLVANSIRQEILLARLATAFGVLALVLAAIGLYGVMSYSVARRTREIGLRSALGARRMDVVRLVLSDAMGLVLAGLVVGLPLAMTLMRLLNAQLHGVGAADPGSIVLSVGVLVGSAIVAVLIPALRASRVSPIAALRES